MKIKYVTSAPDRHGRTRHRFRLNGITRYLPGDPGSDEFDAAHKECLEAARKLMDGVLPVKVQPPERYGQQGTVKRLIYDYRQGGRYAKLAPRTRESYDGVFSSFIDRFGNVEVRSLTRKFVVEMMNGLQATPAKANNNLRVLKLLLNYGILTGVVTTNVTAGVKQYELDEWETWSEEQIATFQKRWPLGTMERRIFNVGLATGQRVSDLIVMQTSDIIDGSIRVVQHKTGAELWLPVIPELAADLADFPPKDMHLIHRRDGLAYTSRHAISNMLKKALREAGLPETLNTHGLRKATCRRLAEAGCSEREIMSVSGHKTSQMVSSYVRKADQRLMATSAFAKIAASNR